jgi:CheY-like chemotaxis protein
MQQDKDLTQEAGMNEHLAKPIDKEMLLKTLLAYI